MSFDTWLHPGTLFSEAFTEPAPTECEKPPFDPTVEAKPTTNVADAPSGLHFDLHLPQAQNEDPEGLGEADLRDARVTLPEGFLVNPSSADGLAACSLAQIGYQGEREGRPSFTSQPANCPDASKVGSVEIDAPAVDHPLPGSVYLAKQNENPFNSLLAIYIAVNDPADRGGGEAGGQGEPGPDHRPAHHNCPRQPPGPLRRLQARLLRRGEGASAHPGGVRHPHHHHLAHPLDRTGSGPDADALGLLRDRHQSPGGGTCPTSAAPLPNSPRFEAGSESPIAGAYTPFIVKLSRQDGSQELKGLNLTLPPGHGRQVRRRGRVLRRGDRLGRSRRRAPKSKRPLLSRHVAPGHGHRCRGSRPRPLRSQGDAYLAGPYKGAPLSMAIITPAVAGPFDLGTVVVRAPLYIDPETAQGTVKSTFPTILQGIPFDVRSIAVAIDRSQFTLNPTSCEAKAVTGEAISTQGQSVALNNRFQVGGCQNLGFKPKLSLKLQGGTKRGAHPSLRQP